MEKKEASGFLFNIVEVKLCFFLTCSMGSCCKCGKKDVLNGCSRCLSVRYCDASCQRCDWDAHKDVCQLLKELSSSTKKLKEKHSDEYANFCSLLDRLGESRFNCRVTEKLFGYEVSLSCVRSLYGDDCDEAATILRNMAMLLESNGLLQKAVLAYEDLLLVLEKRQQSVGTVLTHLAFLQQSLGEHGKAAALYDRAMRTTEEPSQDFLASCMSGKAHVHQSVNEYADAMRLYEESLAIYEVLYGPDSMEVASTLNNMANVWESLQDYPKAIRLYEKSLCIREKLYGADSGKVATTLNNLANVYSTIEDFAKATQLYKASLAVIEKVHGPESENVAFALHNMANVHACLGENDKALECYQRSLIIKERVYGPDSWDVASTLASVANVKRSMGEVSDALALYIRSMAIREKVYGRLHTKTINALYDISSLIAFGDGCSNMPLELREHSDDVLAADNALIEERRPNIVCLRRHLHFLVTSALSRADTGLSVLLKNAAFLRRMPEFAPCALWLMKKVKQMHWNHDVQNEYALCKEAVGLVQARFGHVDEDVRGELLRLREVIQEVKEGMLDTMGESVGGTSMSSVVRNRICEFFSNALHLMDKVFQRFVKHCFSIKGDLYFPVVGAKSLLDAYLELKCGKGIFEKEWAEAYQVLVDLQPFTAWEQSESLDDYREKEWVQKVYCIGNDSKHLRLTPQDARNRVNSAKDGLIPERDVVVYIDYLEGHPQLHDWSMVEGLGGWMSWTQAKRVSAVLAKLLRQDKRYFELVHAIDKYWVVSKQLRDRIFGATQKQAELDKLRDEMSVLLKDGLKRYLEDVEQRDAEYHTVLKRELPQWMMDERSLEFQRLCGQVYDFLLSRLLRHDVNISPANSAPDFRIDALKLVSVTMEGVERLTDVLFQAISRTNDGDVEGVDVADKVRGEDAGDMWMQKAQAASWTWLQDKCEEKACKMYEYTRTPTARVKHVKLMIKRAMRARAMQCFGLEEQLWSDASFARLYCGPLGASLMLSHEMDHARRLLAKRPLRLDSDMDMQLVHCREQIEVIKYECYRAIERKGKPRRRVVRAICMIAEMIVKMRHLLDQGLVRFSRLCIGPEMGATPLQCKFIMAGSEERARQELFRQMIHEEYVELKSEEERNALDKRLSQLLDQRYPGVIKAIMECQPFSFQENPEQSWLEEVFQISNSMKHVKLTIPTERELCELKAAGKCTLMLPFDNVRFYGWTFASVFSGRKLAAEERMRLSLEVRERVANFKLLDKNTFIGTKELAKLSKVELLESVTKALSHSKKSKAPTVTLGEMERIRDMLWNHAQLREGKDERESVQVEAIPLLERALVGVEKVLLAMSSIK